MYYIVTYKVITIDQKGNETKDKFILGIFDSFEKGRDYLRKYYENTDKNVTYDREEIQTNEVKNGNSDCCVYKRMTEMGTTMIEKMKIEPFEVNALSDPIKDINEVLC